MVASKCRVILADEMYPEGYDGTRRETCAAERGFRSISCWHTRRE